LPPHAGGEVRDAAWAVEHEPEIRVQLAARGPELWYSKIEIIKDSKLFTEPNSIDTTAEVFFYSFGYGPEQLAGKRVLDIGAFAGSMTFYAEDCGAEVVALDIQDPQTNGFGVLHEIRRSTAAHVTASIYDIHPDLFGTFDVIVFSGVHYHLKHPLLALERLNAVTRPGGELLALGTAADFWLHEVGAKESGADLATITRENMPALTVESLAVLPLLGFYRDTFMGDTSNWFIPTTPALADMIGAAGYEVLTAATFPTHLSDDSTAIACAVIKARKVGPPDPEYAPDVYGTLRRIGTGTPSATFSIPTWYELERALRKQADVDV
jgi:SAM-dependent methyltransferase